ncbi:hypothetical protein ATANTOWER_007313 [Ataeniobius toweri]|uniref:Uncharacterized protein n=1 Tax=Ataeniobius toweri TaxID=208326 RepID=A0ABU7B594_9TELE|nr:hypothetical protein [Ataeniobius toweri]
MMYSAEPFNCKGHTFNCFLKVYLPTDASSSVSVSGLTTFGSLLILSPAMFFCSCQRDIIVELSSGSDNKSPPLYLSFSLCTVNNVIYKTTFQARFCKKYPGCTLLLASESLEIDSSPE